MKLIRIVLGALSLLSFPIIASAQQEGSLPILHLATDTRLSSMGNASIGEADGGYIYTNPTSLLTQHTRVDVSMGTRVFGKDINGYNLYFFNGSAGIRLGRHALFVGGRHWRGPKVPRVNNEGIEGKSIPLNEATLDLGYAFRLNRHLSAYTSGSYVFSYIGKKAQTAVFNVGLYYRGKGSVKSHEVEYMIGSRLTNFGPQFRYGKGGRKINVPASWDMGAELSKQLSAEYKCSLLAGFRYNFLPIRAKSFGGYVGGEVDYKDMLKGSLGCSVMKGYPMVVSAGLSGKLSLIRLGVVYQHVALSALSNVSGTLSLSF
ncbi:PorV/PorQ family protein [Porphyromonas sp.]|uniref:PorV/PorQ family protein n=1 Tax=Porphyromonas sp. TaxID=1924944 RepID=UPI0026DD966E|nr:PorV/PorQ family protein [Porphyromonas sp.]MDO4771738.1 PorV/PorQ family protein [Porphyromonas sp.]